MSIGIDINSDVIFSYDGENDKGYGVYGSLGIIPRKNEDFIWDNPRASRRSRLGPYISLFDAYSSFMENQQGRGICKWKSDNGDHQNQRSSDLICKAVKANVSDSQMKKSYFAIDNHMNELQQDEILKNFKINGFFGVELLWRPIAICLYFLKEVGRENFDENQKIVVVDFDSYQPEITVLKLKFLRDELVPVRDLPDIKDVLSDSYNNHNLKRDFIKKISKDKDTEKQLKSGQFSGDFFAFLDSDNYRDIFIRNGLAYKKLKIKENWKEDIAKHKVDGHNFLSIKEKIEENKSYQSADMKIWNGFPVRIQDANIFPDSDDEIIIRDKLAVAKGLAEYGKRIESGRPTYLDTLPGLEVFSRSEAAGWKFYNLIEMGEVEGGKKISTENPLTDFRLENGVTEFNSVLRFIASEQVKKLVTEIPPHDYIYDVPLIINAEMLPANGNAVVTIEGDNKHRDIFGRQRRIKLDWKSMEDYEIPDNYSGPEVYPVVGRIVDDEECRSIVNTIVENNLPLNYATTYRKHPITYTSLHGPWGYYWPWQNSGAPINQPQRAMFGAKDENDDEINYLAAGLSDIIQNIPDTKRRHKLLNYMFRYAPETFVSELRGLYLEDNPDLNINSVYGVGRTFFNPQDFEIYVDFFIRKSVNGGCPRYPNGRFTDAYIWSFFRPLCYYENTNQIPIEKAESVLRCIYNDVVNNTATANRVKYILSAVLFSLRFRTNGRVFLVEGSEIRNQMEYLIQNLLPQIPYPPAMFDTQRNDCLNDFVLRFLIEENTQEDMEALQGLITSMS